MSNFDIYCHIEEFERDYLAEQEFYDAMEKLDDAFTSGIKQLLGYKRVASIPEYIAAVHESYEQADEDMKTYLTMHEINSPSDFVIYLNGVVKGMSINE